MVRGYSRIKALVAFIAQGFDKIADLGLDERVRDIPNGVDIPMTLGHYLRSMDQLTRMFNTSHLAYKDPRRQRLYMKDIDCPDKWAEELKNTIPESVYYLNGCIESRTGGDGAIREPNEWGQMRYGKGVAPAGDLMSSPSSRDACYEYDVLHRS